MRLKIDGYDDENYADFHACRCMLGARSCKCITWEANSRSRNPLGVSNPSDSLQSFMQSARYLYWCVLFSCSCWLAWWSFGLYVHNPFVVRGNRVFSADDNGADIPLNFSRHSMLPKYYWLWTWPQSPCVCISFEYLHSCCLSGIGNAILMFFLYQLQNLFIIDVELRPLWPTGCFWVTYACIMNSSLCSVQHCTLCSGTQSFRVTA